MKVFMPMEAANPARELAAFPVEAAQMAEAPASRALATPTAEARSLREAVRVPAVILEEDLDTMALLILREGIDGGPADMEGGNPGGIH